MTKDDVDGVWEAKVKGAEPGQAYRYKIKGFDGNDRYNNDPRALAVTDSDEGNSVIADNIFDWEDFDEIKLAPKDQQVLYEVHIGTFMRLDSATPGLFRLPLKN